MNSTWTVLATACLMIGVLIAESRMEDHNRLTGYKNAKGFTLSIGSIYSFLDPVMLTKTRAVDISPIHERALNDFNVRFGRLRAETWYQVAGGWISYFQTAESEHRGFYTKKGC